MDAIDRVEALLAGQGTARVTKRHLSALSSSPVDLVEFAALRWTRFQSEGEDVLGALPDPPPGSIIQLAQRRSTGIAVLDLAERRGSKPLGHSFAGLRVCEIPSEQSQWDAGSPFRRFEEDFRDWLVRAGCARVLANALSGALSELASNADEHANAPVPPFACFGTNGEGWAFGVCDVGVGVRSSLASNATYERLVSDLDALQAALRPGVSATGLPGRGNGFRFVFKALADRRTRLRIRSGSALALWNGESPTHHNLDWTCPRRQSGFQVGIQGL